MICGKWSRDFQGLPMRTHRMLTPSDLAVNAAAQMRSRRFPQLETHVAQTATLASTSVSFPQWCHWYAVLMELIGNEAERFPKRRIIADTQHPPNGCSRRQRHLDHFL
jgi:hypothetical protein